MQKESAKSAWLFLVKPPFWSILTKRSAFAPTKRSARLERQDIPVIMLSKAKGNVKENTIEARG